MGGILDSRRVLVGARIGEVKTPGLGHHPDLSSSCVPASRSRSRGDGKCARSLIRKDGGAVSCGSEGTVAPCPVDPQALLFVSSTCTIRTGTHGSLHEEAAIIPEGAPRYAPRYYRGTCRYSWLHRRWDLARRSSCRCCGRNSLRGPGRRYQISLQVSL
jgi:hypothetical protein